MKTDRTIPAAIISALALLAALLAGCGGGSGSHDVGTYYAGTIYGVSTDPRDGEEGVETSAAVSVSWPDRDYPPPEDFTFRLDRDDGPYDWTPVYTEMTSDAQHKTWTFDPTSYLSSGHWYKATITDDAGRRQVVFFRTYGTASTSLQSKSAGGQTRGLIEHHVTTRPQQP